MKIEITQAKNGEKTLKIDSSFVHSSYAPSTEAQRFIDSFSLPFSPSCIVLIEPGLDYLIKTLKKTFPSAKFGVIRYLNTTDISNQEYNFSIFADKEDVKQKLFEYLTEEDLCSTYFLPWKASSRIFSDLDSKVWKLIKQSVEQAKTILISREYFEKKWLLNCCKNVTNIKKIFTLKNKIDLPIFIIASGPSLQSKIEFLKENQNKAFIICLSSAISVLVKNNITPDFCFTTDGGYWAGEHLKKLDTKKLNLGIASEAFCPSKLYKKSNIVLMNYSDGFSNEIFKTSGLNTLTLKRNGTVSGTALDFCLDYSDKDIYFFGLDLSACKGFQHSNPNELEYNNSIRDSRITSVEKRMTGSICRADSLLIYENWFKNKKLNGRKIFRIIENDEANNNLSEILDISLKELKQIFNNYTISKKTFFDYFLATNIEINKEKIYSFILENLNNEKYLKMLFPLDYVALSHNNSDIQLIKNRINEKTNLLKKKLEKLFNENK